MPGVPGVTVVTMLVCFTIFACEAAGASSARHSLLPLFSGVAVGKARAFSRRENADGCVLVPSSRIVPSKALGIRKPNVKGAPASARRSWFLGQNGSLDWLAVSVKPKPDRDAADLSNRQQPPFNRFSSRRPHSEFLTQPLRFNCDILWTRDFGAWIPGPVWASAGDPNGRLGSAGHR